MDISLGLEDSPRQEHPKPEKEEEELLDVGPIGNQTAVYQNKYQSKSSNCFVQITHKKPSLNHKFSIQPLETCFEQVLSEAPRKNRNRICSIIGYLEKTNNQMIMVPGDN